MGREASTFNVSSIRIYAFSEERMEELLLVFELMVILVVLM